MEIRDAQFDDWKKLLEWVNSPESLSNKKLTSYAISEHDHKCWLKNLLERDGVYLFIILEHDQPVGQMRFQSQDDQNTTFIIDIFIDEKYRGRDLASRALAKGIKNLRARKAPAELFFIAELRKSNTASLSLFRKLGFILDQENADFSTLKTIR